MTGEGLFPGMPFHDNVRLRLAESKCVVTVSAARSRHYALEENFCYLIRDGARPVIAPRMAYGAEVTRALCEVYGEEARRFVGEKDLAQARGDHS